jgi:DNA repair exonuclease SbcCD ATPase subunit
VGAHASGQVAALRHKPSPQPIQPSLSGRTGVTRPAASARRQPPARRFDTPAESCDAPPPAGPKLRRGRYGTRHRMRTFLVNLMIALSLGLCVLIWFQWVREGRSQASIQTLTDGQQNLKEQIQGLEANVKSSQAEIVRLDELKKQFQEQVKTNVAYTISLVNTNDLLRRDLEVRIKQVAAYKEAIEEANAAIKRQNEDVEKQNAELERLSEERNEIAQKYNKAVTDFNDLAEKWNKLNADLAAAATNAPAKK